MIFGLSRGSLRSDSCEQCFKLDPVGGLWGISGNSLCGQADVSRSEFGCDE